MKYYSASKKKLILIDSATSMKLEDIMLDERSQPKWQILYDTAEKVSRIVTFTEVESGRVVPKC